MVASSPMDDPKTRQPPRMGSELPATSPAAARPLIPAERDINAFMNGFNAGVVDFLKGENANGLNC